MITPLGYATQKQLFEQRCWITLVPGSPAIQDLFGAITHKREIITLYLEGYLTPEIAVKTHHFKEAVDRYIRDYHRVENLWKHGITDLDQISQLARLSHRVVHQYIDLLPQKVRTSPPSVDRQSVTPLLEASGQTEAGSAGEQPVKG